MTEFIKFRIVYRLVYDKRFYSVVSDFIKALSSMIKLHLQESPASGEN